MRLCQVGFLGRMIAVLPVTVLVALTVSQTAARAEPLEDQWEFESWHIEETVWPLAKGQGVTVAIVESGVAPIPDLKAALLPTVDMVDTEATGHKDYDENGHGTVMASVIASSGEETGFLGIAPEARIIPVVLDRGAFRITDGRLARGIKRAVDSGAKVLNMSFGIEAGDVAGGCPEIIQDAIQYVVDKGGIVVAAAGNEGRSTNAVDYPGACPGVVTVGAVDEDDQAWPDSQRQPYIDVAAPGVDNLGIDKNDEVIIGSGTSFSTAMTSGAIALVWSRFPKLSNRQVVARILATLGEPPPGGKRDQQRGFGRVRLDAAITANVPADAPNPLFDELTARRTNDPPNPGGAGRGPDGVAGPDDGGVEFELPLGVNIPLIAGLALANLCALVGLVARGPRRPAVPPVPPRPFGPQPFMPPYPQRPPPPYWPEPYRWRPPGTMGPDN